MKRVGNIYEKIIQLGNIESAVMHAAKGKSKRKNVEKILDSPTYYAMQVQKMLKEHTYIPSPYVEMKILDGARKAASMLSYSGWLKHCNSYNYQQKYIKPYINYNKCKEVVSNESKKRQASSK